MTFGEQLADQADHILHVRRGMWGGVGTLDAERVHDLPPHSLVAGGNLIGWTLL